MINIIVIVKMGVNIEVSERKVIMLMLWKSIINLFIVNVDV